MKENEYKCDLCLNIFEKGWSDAEAAKEFDSNFPGHSMGQKDIAVLCSDCFSLVMDNYENNNTNNSR